MSGFWFRVEGDELLPQPSAGSNWADGSTVRGMASSSVMARAAERAVSDLGGSADLRPVRWTADLSRPVPLEPLRTRTEILRRGRRICLVDVELLTADAVVARARGLWALGGVDPEGQRWAPARELALPPEGPGAPRLYYSEARGWTSESEPHQNASRKQLWLAPAAVVEHEAPSPFQFAAAVADLASVVTHWGSEGLPYINADLTLHLARLPRGPELGIAALDRVEADGVAVGTALVHDRDGVIGTSTVSAIAYRGSPVIPGQRG